MPENTVTITIANNKVVSASEYASGKKAYDYLRDNRIDSYYGRVMSWGDEVYLEDLPMVDYFCRRYNDGDTLRKIQLFVMAGSFMCQHWTGVPASEFPGTMTLEEALDCRKVQFFYGNWRKPVPSVVCITARIENYNTSLKPEYEGDKYYNIDASWENFIGAIAHLNERK